MSDTPNDGGALDWLAEYAERVAKAEGPDAHDSSDGACLRLVVQRFRESQAKVTRLERERDEALTALREFGRHKHTCRQRLGPRGHACTCGWGDDEYSGARSALLIPTGDAYR